MSASRLKLILLWIAGGTIAYLFARLPMSDFFAQGNIVPYDPDSFYHAERILHLINHGVLLQFDPRTNSPYGQVISWPWAYDTLMAFIVSVIRHIKPDISLLYVLLSIPPFMVFINAALIICIAKSLKLSLPYSVMALACFAFSPLTQGLHLLGKIDHHMVEHTFVLAAILFGIRWLNNPGSKLLPVILGIILGAAPAFHNSLFILQLPILITFIILWVYGKSLPDYSHYFIAGLVVLTFLTLLPSEPFITGRFSYYYHSWFHLYVACCTALLISILLKVEVSVKNILLLSGISALLTVPLLSEVASGITFIGGENQIFERIDEMKSPLGFNSDWLLYSPYVIREYSALFVLLPVSLLILLVWFNLNRSAYALYFLVFSVFGSAMLLSQFRLNYFGSYALYFPLLIGAMTLSGIVDKYKPAIPAITALILMVAYYPSVNTLFGRHPLGGSYDYELTRAIYKDMADNCAKRPGTVLADNNDGHFISFHTECSVIANNMIISPEDFERVRETYRLMGLTANKIIQDERWIDYIFVRREDNIYANNDMSEIMHVNQGLRAELLFNDEFPAGLSLIATVYFDNGGHPSVLARLFSIQR